MVIQIAAVKMQLGSALRIRLARTGRVVRMVCLAYLLACLLAIIPAAGYHHHASMPARERHHGHRVRKLGPAPKVSMQSRSSVVTSFNEDDSRSTRCPEAE